MIYYQRRRYELVLIAIIGIASLCLLYKNKRKANELWNEKWSKI